MTFNDPVSRRMVLKAIGMLVGAATVPVPKVRATSRVASPTGTTPQLKQGL